MTEATLHTTNETSFPDNLSASDVPFLRELLKRPDLLAKYFHSKHAEYFWACEVSQSFEEAEEILYKILDTINKESISAFIINRHDSYNLVFMGTQDLIVNLAARLSDEWGYTEVEVPAQMQSAVRGNRAQEVIKMLIKHLEEHGRYVQGSFGSTTKYFYGEEGIPMDAQGVIHPPARG